MRKSRLGRRADRPNLSESSLPELEEMIHPSGICPLCGMDRITPHAGDDNPYEDASGTEEGTNSTLVSAVTFYYQCAYCGTDFYQTYTIKERAVVLPGRG